MYHTDRPYTTSAYSSSYRQVGGSASPSPLRSQRFPMRSDPLTDEDRRSRGHSAGVDRVFGALDGGRYAARVLAGRRNVSDVPRSSSPSYGREQRHEHAESRAYGQRSASPSDAVDLYPVFDVDYQRRVRQTPATDSRTDLVTGASSACATHDQRSGQRVFDAMTATSSQFCFTALRPSGTSRQYWNHVAYQRQHGRLSPETLVSSRHDLRQSNSSNCASSMSVRPRYGAYDYGKAGNGHANGGNDVAPDGAEMRNGLQGQVYSGLSGHRSPTESSSNSTAVTSPSRSYDSPLPVASLSRLDVGVSPHLEAHQLSLSCASLPQAAAASKAPHRSASSSSSSSSSSTPPNIIRRHLKTIARLAALGGGRAPVHVTSTPSRQEPDSTHGKPTLTRSSSEPEAVDRVANLPRGSAGEDEYGFSCSYPSYRVRALLDQRDNEPPSPTTFVGRSSADSGGADCVRSTKCSTFASKSSKSTTKSSSRLILTPADGRMTSSLMLQDRALPKVGCFYS